VYLTDIPRIPGSLAVILPLTEALRQRNLIATGPLGSQNDRALGLQRWNSQVSRAQGVNQHRSGTPLKSETSL
jgi:hypothetical protein